MFDISFKTLHTTEDSTNKVSFYFVLSSVCFTFVVYKQRLSSTDAFFNIDHTIIIKTIRK